MPNGGQISAGSGLRLQVATPGAVDTGNANISGMMLATGFSTSGGVNNAPEIFGRGNGPLANYGNLSAVFGCGNSVSNGGAGNIVMIGVNNTASSQNSVALGMGNVAGNAGGYSSLAVGYYCSAGNGVEGSQRVAMGWHCTASGARNVAMGNNVQIINTNGANGNSVGYGQDISCGIGATGNMLFGEGIAPVSRANVLVVGAWGVGIGLPDYPVTVVPGQQDNSILIGNVNQVNIQLGPLTLTKQTVAGAKGGNAALGSLLTALASMGLINDTTTA